MSDGGAGRLTAGGSVAATAAAIAAGQAGAGAWPLHAHGGLKLPSLHAAPASTTGACPAAIAIMCRALPAYSIRTSSRAPAPQPKWETIVWWTGQGSRLATMAAPLRPATRWVGSGWAGGCVCACVPTAVWGSWVLCATAARACSGSALLQPARQPVRHVWLLPSPAGPSPLGCSCLAPTHHTPCTPPLLLLLLQAKGGAFTGDEKDFFRFKLGDHSVIPAFEEAVEGMQVGGQADGWAGATC